MNKNEIIIYSNQQQQQQTQSTFYLDDVSNNRTNHESSSSNINNKNVSVNDSNNTDMQDFLEQARNGNLNRVSELIESSNNKQSNEQNESSSTSLSSSSSFDINYKGKPKRFYGWTALHISCYFNHIDIVKLLLQHPDCDINVCNYENDTPLHKACLTSRYEIVELLLLNNADINIKNNEGLKPKDLVTDPTVKKLMQAAENAETHNLQKLFFEAVSSNDIEDINKLIKNKNFDINCTDTFGNTALHLVSNRNSCELAVLLIQKGINTLIKNHNHLTALDLAKSKEMKEILGYVPYNWRKYEGILLKKRKFLGYKEYYVVLNKGTIIYYSNKKDAIHDTNRKGSYFLNNAFIKEYQSNNNQDFPAYSWTINYTNGRKHTLSSAIPIKKKTEHLMNEVNASGAIGSGSEQKKSKRTHLNPLERKKKWIQAINEHIRFSDSNLQQNECQNLLPMESLQQNLNTLKLNEDKLNFLLIQIDQQFVNVSASDLNQIPSQSSLHQIYSNYKTNFENLKQQIKTVLNDANKCINIHEQRDTLFKSQLAEAKHKSELLEQSLRVIAQENHDLESKKKIHNNNNNNAANVTPPSPESAASKMSTKDNEVPSDEDDEDDECEEFFDIADDPLTDEELDNKSDNNNNLETQSLALRSCYGSINDLNEVNNNNNKQTTSAAAAAAVTLPITKSQLDFDKNGWRTRLPVKMFDRSQISIWSILKQFIGKELSKIAMPAALCEPLSFLQRISENVYYSDLLHKAAHATNPCKRMEYVAAYAVTNISSNIDRLSKPFNPLLGETYELVRDDLGFRIVCEQVSHHPPVSAFHCDSTRSNNEWKFYGCVNPKIKFWGKSIEVTPKGTLTLELNKFNETYTWQQVTCCVHNIIVGKLWFEYYGIMEITCNQTGYKAIVNFKPYSWSNKELHKLDGYIYDNKKTKLKALYGFWTHCVYTCDANDYDNYIKTNKPLPMVQLDEFFNEISTADSANNNINGHINNNNNSNSSISSNVEQKLVDETKSKLSLVNNNSNHIEVNVSAMSGTIQLNATEIWRATPRPTHGADYYMFNYFTMTLNEMKDEFEKVIAPTDSRFRTDVRQLELGDLDRASQEKSRLEEKQRESRNKHGKYDHKGKWFQVGKHPFCSEETWLFNNKYWSRNYNDCPDLY